jgi:hypothetical protein
MTGESEKNETHESAKNDLTWSPDATVGLRASFWCDVPSKSNLRPIYDCIPTDSYFNTQVLSERLLQIGCYLTDLDISSGLETLAAAGIILPLVLEIQDAANPSGPPLAVPAYRRLRPEDDGSIQIRPALESALRMKQ